MREAEYSPVSGQLLGISNSLDYESITASPLLFLSLTYGFHCSNLFRLIYMFS